MSECRQTVVESPLQASPALGVQVPSSTASEVVSQLATESSLEGDIFCGAVEVGLINPDPDPDPVSQRHVVGRYLVCSL